jgi:hypothetical protein
MAAFQNTFLLPHFAAGGGEVREEEKIGEFVARVSC